MGDPGVIAAAGAVVLRRRSGTSEVLIVHRPKYDDWSFPKGKLDPGETARTAAVREVLEETGVEIRLGPPLSFQAYVVSNGNGQGRAKVVEYWVGRPKGDHDVTGYEPNHEIDDVQWLDVDKARHRLTYARDRETLAEAMLFVHKTWPLIVVRHAEARPRKSWQGDDRERTLTEHGERQAERLSPVLAAYGIERLVSSSSRRCWTTLVPYGVQVDRNIEVTDDLSEEDATELGVSEEIEWLVELRDPVVVCSHRPVLPLVFEALWVDPPPLDLAGMLVVHHRHGRISALERIAAPSGD